MATAVYPGSFDPVTKGHLDIIKRAAKINDHLIVAVLINSAKHPLFTVEERVAMLQECCKNIPNVTVEGFDGLTVEFAKKRHASVMVRGLRAVTDFENEIQLAQTNHALKIQAALFVPCSCPGGTTQKIPSYYFLSKNSLIWSFGTISDLKA